MLKGLRTAETAMNIQMNRTNVLANNLANVNTAGFKKVLTQVTEHQAGADQQLETSAPTRSMRGGAMKDLILDVRAPIDMTQGSLRETGRATDVAVQGEGLFKVQHDGRTFYTRDGAFSVNEARQLVTASGDRVIGAGGPVELPQGEILIRRDGTILVDGAESARLDLVTFDDTGRLTHVGASLFDAPEDLEATPVPVDQVAIQQGVLEESNVNPIETMVAMIAAQRAFEMEAKVLQAADSTLDKGINQLSARA